MLWDDTGSTFTYDGAGNIKAMAADGVRKPEGDSFVYGRVSRLRRATLGGLNATQCYGFDPFGNLTGWAQVVGSGACTPPGSNTNAATNRLLPPASYDAAGNLTGWGSGQDAFTASWDALNQLRSLQGLGVNRRFAYDAHGERILVREVNLSPVVYTLTVRDLAGKVLREVSYTPSTGSWAWRKDYVWREGYLLASVSASEGLRHYHLDHLGSPRLVTDRCGERLASWQLWPFGLDPQGQPGGGGQHSERMRFTGHERDLHLFDRASDDVDYMHARYYSPLLARFLSVDPGRDNDLRAPQSWNLYAYVKGNPIRSVDPTGLWEKDFHLLVTQYLALAAGRSPGDASAIAKANQEVDDAFPAGLGARKAEFELHFGSLETGRELYALAQNPAEEGAALHCVQDSFSHAGYRYPFGHLRDLRRPDKVYLRPHTAMAAAEETHRLLAGGSDATFDKGFLEKVFATKDDALRVALLRSAIKALEEKERNHVKKPALAPTASERKP